MTIEIQPHQIRNKMGNMRTQFCVRVDGQARGAFYSRDDAVLFKEALERDEEARMETLADSARMVEPEQIPGENRGTTDTF